MPKTSQYHEDQVAPLPWKVTDMGFGRILIADANNHTVCVMTRKAKASWPTFNFIVLAVNSHETFVNTLEELILCCVDGTCRKCDEAIGAALMNTQEVHR